MTPRTTVDLDHDQYERIVQLAQASGRSLGEVVDEALGRYLTRQGSNGPANGGATPEAQPVEQQLSPEGEDDWRRRLDDLLARARAGVPEDQLAGKSDRELIADYLMRQGARVVPAPPGVRRSARSV